MNGAPQPRRSALGRVARSACGGAVVAAIGGLVLGVGAAADVPQLDSYTATAAANGVRTELAVPGFPLSANVFDGGAPVAQATVNGLGTSSAVASMPYPGENATTLPGLVFPLVGLPAPPPYPLLVTSAYPNQRRPQGAEGPVSLRAESDERSSTAEGAAGGGANGNNISRIAARAIASVDDDTSDVTAEARSSAESVTIASVLTVGSIVSTAKAVASPDGTPVFESSFEVSGARLAGLTIGITNEGIVLPGTTVPIPGTSGLSPLLDSLHIALEYLPSQTFADGIMSAGLRVTLPTPATLGAGTLTLTFGRVIATTTSTSEDATASTPADIDTPGAPSLTPRPSAGSTATGVPRAATTSAPAPSAGEPQPAAAARDTPLVTVRATSFYLMLIVGAAVAVIVTSLLRLFGVRLAWIG